MPSIRKRLRNAAVTAVVASGVVVVAAAPSAAIDRVNTMIVRDIVFIDPLPEVGDIVDVNDLPSCGDPTVSYCSTGPAFGPFYVPNVDYDTVHVTDVVGYIDTYDAAIGQIGTNLFTCVSFVQPTVVDPCSGLGFQRLNRVPLLAQPVDAYIPKVAGQPLTSVTVCSAQVNILNGALRFPALTVC